MSESNMNSRRTLSKEEQDAMFARFLDPNRASMPDIDRNFYRPRRWALRLKWESWVRKFKISR